MNIKVRNARRLFSGLLILAFGLAGAYFASHLKFGTPAAMGPGFLPTVCSWLIVLFGIIELMKVAHEDIEVIDPVVPRPVFMIFLSIGLFAFLIDRAGLAATVFVTTLIASYAGPTRLWEALVLAMFAAVAVAVVFVVLLGLPIQVWPEFG